MQRPLSPHLQIYTPQLTSVLSILHRLTGLGFIAALTLACTWLYTLSEGLESHHKFCTWLNQPLMKIIFYLILTSVYYHLLNGIRYLVWSLGMGFELQTVNNSGWIVVCTTIALSTLTVIVL